MNRQTFKKGIFSILVLSALLLLAACGQQKSVDNNQQDGLENNPVSSIEQEANSNTTPEAAEQETNVAPAPTETEPSPKVTQQQAAQAQNSNSNTSAPATPGVNPSGNTGEGNKTTVRPEGATTSNLEEVKDRLKNSIQGLVIDGTISPEQAEKIIDHFVQGAASGSGIRISPNSFNDLAEQGVITQEQADAVMNALMSNSQGTRMNQKTN